VSRRSKRESAFSLFAFQDIITAVTGIMLLITLLLTLELIGRQDRASQAAASQAISPDIVATEDEINQLASQVDALRKQHKEMVSVNTLLAKYDDKQLSTELENTRRTNTKTSEEIEKLKKKLHSAVTEQEKVKESKDNEILKQLNEKIEKTKVKLKEIQKSSRIFVRTAESSSKTNWLIEISKNGLKVAQMGKVSVPNSFTEAYSFKRWLGGRNNSSDHFVLLVKAGGISLYNEISVLLDHEGYSKGSDILQQADHVIDDKTGAGIP
jgi:regulator of replication initiation timing